MDAERSHDGSSPVPSARDLTLIGLLAAAVSLALLWAGSRIEPSLVFPPLALAELVIRLTPGDVATFFIEGLAEWAIRMLAIGATAAMAVIGGMLAWRSARRGLAAASFGVLLLAAAFGANVEPSPAAALVVAVVGGLAYGVALRWLRSTAAATLEAEADMPRRRVFAGAVSAALGLALGGTLLGRLLHSGAGTEVAIGSPLRPAKVPERLPFPRISGLSPEVTSVADHYVVDINLTQPVVDADSWTLSVEGLVEQPLELSLEDLQGRFGLVEEYSVLTCVSNEVGGPLVGNSKWTGVPLGEVLGAAGLRSEAQDLLLTGADGYTVTIRPEVATSPTALLAIAQNGEALTVEHGAPCRLRVPQLYGMMNCKWLERIEAISADEEGYWAQRGWSDLALVRTQSRIDSIDPTPAAGGGSWIAGVAWAGDRGISRVEVSTDGGASWQRARLRRPLSPLAWSQWAHKWTPERSGATRLAVRAADGTARLQTAALAAPHPAGATGYHEIDLGPMPIGDRTSGCGR